jgi:hypothetical protein
VTERMLSCARVGDEDAFGLVIEPREELQLHSQRVLALRPDLGEAYAPWASTEKAAPMTPSISFCVDRLGSAGQWKRMVTVRGLVRPGPWNRLISVTSRRGHGSGGMVLRPGRNDIVRREGVERKPTRTSPSSATSIDATGH